MDDDRRENLAALSAALAEAREVIELSFDSAPIGMALLAPDGRLEQVNPALCALLGLAEAELLQTSFGSLSHPDDREADRELLQECLAGGRTGYQADKRLIGADGSVIEARLSVSLIRDRDGAPLRFVAQVVDVTALGDARRRAESYLNVAGALIVVLDTEARIVLANPALTSALGYADRDLTGADWMSLALTPETSEQSRRAFASVMIGERDANPAYENVVVTATGAHRRIQWTSVVTRDAGGRITGLLKSGVDITERSEAEEALRRHAEDLSGLRALAQAVAGSQDARQAIVEGVRRLAGASMSALYEPIEDGVLAVTATTTEIMKGVELDVRGEVSGAGAAFTSGRRLFVADAATNKQISQVLATRLKVASALYEPILIDGRPRAVLVVAWQHRVDALDAREADLVAVAAIDVAYAIAQQSSIESLRSQALTDPLTGIANRRAFELELDAALARARASGQPLGLALMDFNDFKALNDREGHDAGDRLLKATTASWSAAVRDGDVLARIGGDEFALLVPGCDERARAELPPRLLAGFEHGPGCGIGLVVWDFEESAESLVRRADAALYADKAAIKRALLDDAARLRAVAAALALAPGVEPELRGLTDATALALGVPIAIVSLVDERRQYFVCTHGLRDWPADERGVPLSQSFCQHSVTTGQTLVVDDARTMPLVAGVRAVAGLDVIAYAGAPLIDGGGQAFGTLCAVDHQPRRWSQTDLAILERLAAAMAALLTRSAAVSV